MRAHRTQAARNAASLLDDLDAAEAAEEEALHSCECKAVHLLQDKLKRAHADGTRKIENLNSIIVQKDEAIEKLKASLKFHVAIQQYQCAQRSPLHSCKKAHKHGKQELRKTKDTDDISSPRGMLSALAKDSAKT